MRRAALTLALALGCTPSAEVVVVDARELGVLETAAGVVERERGYSEYAFGRSVWLFGATRLAAPDQAGALTRDNGWSTTIDLGAKDGIDLFNTPTDEAGGPAELLTLTSDELAFNANSDDGARLLLWPLTAVRDDQNDRVLLFYAKLRASAAGELTRIGSSVAVWTELEFGPVRPILDAASDEPNLLFRAPEPEFGQAALIVDGQLYAYACADELYRPCKLARVEIDAVFERGAWEFWTGRDWSAQVDEAVVLLEADTVFSVTHSPHLRRFLAFHGAGDSGEIFVRAAEQPEGPWSTPTLVFRADAPVADVVLHSEYRRGGGEIEVLSYRANSQLHLLEVVLAPGE